MSWGWYVSRNGETVGPVHHEQVADWVRDGMRNALVRSDFGGAWVQLYDSPFCSLLPLGERGATGKILAWTINVFCVLLIVVLGKVFGAVGGLVAGLIGWWIAKATGTL